MPNLAQICFESSEMRTKTLPFSNFSLAAHSESLCFRPDNEDQIAPLLTETADINLLARGNGSSYSDCCLLNKGLIINTSRLNHLLTFDENSQILVCQGAVSFADLFLVHDRYIPPVIPGTLKATVAGGIANDIHGKNNPQQGTFGEHILSLELQLGSQSYHCDRKTHADLFEATLAGLGLTGLIKRVSIKMRKASHFVVSHSEKYFAWEPLLERMKQEGCRHDYQVAWLDLLNEPCALLSFADHCEGIKGKEISQYEIPKLPLRLINRWLMKPFNRYYFKNQPTAERILTLPEFNNPLDKIKNWNRLYGKKGLLQFQALIDENLMLEALNILLKIIHHNQALPTLAVLKYFKKSGQGLLSFAKPGFTLAIDFVNNPQARLAILAMNEWLTEAGGKIYLAKDLLLNEAQFKQQYPRHEEFSKLLERYKSPMRSDLSNRLGITK